LYHIEKLCDLEGRPGARRSLGGYRRNQCRIQVASADARIVLKAARGRFLMVIVSNYRHSGCCSEQHELK